VRQLKGAHLKDIPGGWSLPEGELRCGRSDPSSDIPSECHIDPRALQKVSNEDRGRRLSIRPGDGDQWTREEPYGKLGFGDPPHAARAELPEHWSVGGNSRGYHDEIRRFDAGEIVGSQFDPGSQLLELSNSKTD